MLTLAALTASGFVATGPLVRAPAATSSLSARACPLRLDEGMSEYEKYLAGRSGTEMANIEAEYKSFKGIDQEFDGGDSGGGVVGDGNTDLEDQHNSATLGALRGGIADVTSATMAVGRGNVKTLDDTEPNFGGSQSGQTASARAAAGGNYFGRSTGLADKLASAITDDDAKSGRMDCVRAQQKENWFNQRAIHAQNRAAGQGVVFGAEPDLKPREGGFNSQDYLSSSTARNGAKEGEISQRDLASHMSSLAAKPAARLDGEEWEELTLTAADDVIEIFEVRASPRQTTITVINIKNDYNTFAPYVCGFIAGSSDAFSVSPEAGTMNRRSGEPVEVTVRYTPSETGTVMEGMLVFQTEDMKKVYKFVGST